MSYKVWKDEPFYWAPQKKIGGGWIAYKSSSAPPPPDYRGAAAETAAGNLENLKYQTAANRPDQETPWGSSTWIQDPVSQKWTQQINLTPDMQRALDNQQQIQNSQSDLAKTLQGQVTTTMGQGFNAPDLSGYLQGVNPVQQNFAGFDRSGLTPVNTNAPTFDADRISEGSRAAYDAKMALISPQMEQDATNLDSKLRLQGLTPGTEAYNNAMQNLQRTQAQTRTEAANQAVITGSQLANSEYAAALAGYGAGNQAQAQNYNQALAAYGADSSAQQASNAAVGQAQDQALQNFGMQYQTALQNYLQPLNSMNAVLTGQQVQSPALPNFTNAGYVPGADYSGAASSMGQWNSGVAAQQQAANSSNNALVGSLAMAAAYF
jgi:hypothetical protein